MIIFIDLDDTIENLLETWVTTLNELYGYSVDVNEIDDWNLSRFYSLTQKQLTSPFYSKDFWTRVSPKPDAVKYIKKLIDDGHEVYIVTATFYKFVEPKVELIIKEHFPYFPLNNIIICNKKQLLNGDILIDDYPQNLIGGSYKKILFDCNHNKNFDEKLIGAIRTNNWEMIYNLIVNMNKKDD